MLVTGFQGLLILVGSEGTEQQQPSRRESLGVAAYPGGQNTKFQLRRVVEDPRQFQRLLK